MVKKYLITLTATIFIFSCNENPEKKEYDESFAITNFKGLPSEIYGCSCYFSDNEKCFNNDEYSFVYNSTDSVAYISINNKKIELKLLSVAGSPNKPNFTKTYKNDIYTVKVIIKSTKQTGEELSWEEGTLLIEKNGQNFT